MDKKLRESCKELRDTLEYDDWQFRVVIFKHLPAVLNVLERLTEAAEEIVAARVNGPGRTPTHVDPHKPFYWAKGLLNAAMKPPAEGETDGSK